MFSSIFGAADPHAQNFHPAGEGQASAELFGELTPKDLEWTIGSGICTETQVWYHTLNDGRFLLFQIIHSSVGLWYPTVQFTCKIWDPKTKEKTWKSINVANFVTPPPKNKDKRSSQSDSFTVMHVDNASTPEFPEAYAINANIDAELQLALVVSRPAAVPGFKLGKGPSGGFSYFGADKSKPDGYVIHRFWPRTTISGHVIHKGAAAAVEGTGMFIHAIQGMRPDSLAASWNFADFQSEEKGGASAVMMQFKTTDAYGRKGAGSGGVSVSIGSLVVGGKLISVVGETSWPGEDVPVAAHSKAIHHDPTLDPETGYKAPSKIQYLWEGSSAVKGVSGAVKAELVLDVGTPSAPKGLIEKVDVLAEIPKMVKTVIAYVAGTKPYIYQWYNPATLTVTAPGAVLDGSDESSKTITLTGNIFNEATFIS